MEVKLENLIEKIKKEGIEDGKAAGEQLVAEARAQATSIIEKAKKEAAELVENGKKEAAGFQANAERAIAQAARDGELVLRERISELFDRVFKARIATALEPALLKELIKKIVSQWKPGAGIEVVLSPEDEKKLVALLSAGLKDELIKGVTLRPSPAVAAGFRIGLKGEDVSYDFTDESFAELLRSFVNPSIRKILEG